MPVTSSRSRKRSSRSTTASPASPSRPQRPFDGLAALVTGAGGDIGAAIVAALAARGAGVGLVGRRTAALERAAHRAGGDATKTFTADLTADEQLKATVRAFLRHFGRIDILVHSNGIHRAAPLAEAKVADFDRLWAANVRGPFLLTQLLLPGLQASSGQITFVNSSVVLAPRAGVGQFTATQQALRAVADTLRVELNPEGIRVLSVYPGRTATSRSEKLSARERRPYRPDRLLQPEEIATVVAESLALPRTAEVTDISIRPMLKPD